MKETREQPRKIDRIIEERSKEPLNSVGLTMRWLYIPLIAFGFFGAVWSIPFPQLEFLGKYNGYINWASFLLAIVIYFYNTVSPILAFGMIWVVFLFSAGIVSLEKMHLNPGWPNMGLVCLAILVLGLVLQWIGYKKETQAPSLLKQISTALYGPLWMIHQLFSKTGIKV